MCEVDEIIVIFQANKKCTCTRKIEDFTYELNLKVGHFLHLNGKPLLFRYSATYIKYENLLNFKPVSFGIFTKKKYQKCSIFI